ncbi:MAG: response regulator [Gallionellaceae bacterium]|nr:response regulator [Gallionellaceae bacterium]
MTQTHLLLVEDDLLILRTLARGLREAGYHISEAESAEEAMNLCADIRPDLAVLDVRMRGLSGLELGRWLAERDISFLFLTAYDDEGFVREALQAGALGYLVKPLDVPRIIPSLETALARSRDLAGLRESEEKLVAALQNSREISTAIGLLMERKDLSAEQAFDLLRGQARSQRIKVLELAREILAGKGSAEKS